MKTKLLNEIRNYEPYNEQEEMDRTEILRLLEGAPEDGGGLFTRENRQCHMTASAWVVNKERTKVLMVYHNIYRSWSWLGGHADGETDLLRTAVREVTEESGISHVTPVSEEIFSLEILTVDGHIKNGIYVPSHLHLNLTYLLEADEEKVLQAKPDENSGAAWFSPEDAVKASSEPWFQKHIYPKLNEKLRVFCK